VIIRGRRTTVHRFGEDWARILGAMPHRAMIEPPPRG
jgi:hypothetical protein